MKPAGIAEELSGAFAGARGLLSNLLDLFGLEARRAGLMLVLMLACGVSGAVLSVAAWIGLLAALVLWAVARGMEWPAALAAVAFANAAAAGVLFWLCGRASRELAFPATRRELRPKRLELVVHDARGMVAHGCPCEFLARIIGHGPGHVSALAHDLSRAYRRFR